MADNAEVLKGIKRKEGVWYPVLTPNVKVKLGLIVELSYRFHFSLYSPVPLVY